MSSNRQHDRRDFLKRSTAATADFGLASVARRPARAELDASATGNGMSDDAETVRLGFVGLGGRGTEGQPIRQGFDTFFGYLD